jgi:RsiW-degrading membrane proteinase PrsW (M82 family)
MDPLSFYANPDWRSAILAAAFTLPWLALLARGYLRSRWLWLAVVAAAILFPFSIAWIQVPIQSLVLALLGTSINRYLLLAGLPIVFVSGLVQESIKLLVAIGCMRFFGRRQEALTGLAFGAASGAGYGGFEAFWVFNSIFASGITLAAVQLAGPLALLGFVERFFAVLFHVGAAALSGYGYATGRVWRFLFLAIALHTLANYSILVNEAGLIGSIGIEIWAAVISIATIGAALWLHWRLAHTTKPGAGHQSHPE